MSIADSRDITVRVDGKEIYVQVEWRGTLWIEAGDAPTSLRITSGGDPFKVYCIGPPFNHAFICWKCGKDVPGHHKFEAGIQRRGERAKSWAPICDECSKGWV